MNDCPTPHKLSYDTRAKAKKAAKRTGQGSSRDGRLHAYLCNGCGFFHVGTMPPWMIREGRNHDIA